MSEKQDKEAQKTPEETLAECADAVVRQNLQLIELAGMRGFNPVVALDYTANGAGLLIRRLFEAVGAFEEGTVPWRTTMGDLFRTTGSLIETLMGRKNAPVMELEAVAVAFRQCMILWSDTHSPPRMTRKKYLKKIFDGETKFCNKLVELHAAYLRIQIARGGRKRALSAADAMGDESRNAAGERARVLNEIERLSGVYGSVTKAIKMMRGGTYSARMKGVSDATWRKYHYDRQTAKRRRQTLKYSRPKMIGDGINMMSDGRIGACEPVNEPVKYLSEPVNEPVNATDEPVNQPSEPVNCRREPVSEIVKSLIMKNPGITSVQIVGMLPQSHSTVKRALSALKKSGCIEHRGSDKTGGYYAIAENAPERSGICGEAWYLV